MKKLFTLFLFALLAITSAWAADAPFYTLQCEKNGSNSGYANYYNVNINGMDWSAPGNQTQGDFWRIGGNSITAKDRTITGKSPMKAEISKITIFHNGFGGSGTPTLNHVKVIVGSDESFSKTIDEVTVTPNISASGSFNISPTEGKTWTSGSFYKIIFNLTKTTSKNAGLDLTKIEFFKSATSTTPGKTATSLSFGADWDEEITKYIGENEFPCPTATLTPEVEGAAITYASDNENVAAIVNGYIMLGDAEGKASITASYAGNDTYDASSASFTIDLQKLPDPTFSPAPGAVVAGTVVTIKAPIDGATIDVSYEPEGEATEVVKNVAETTITISKPTDIMANTVFNGAESDGVYATYTIKTLDAIEITGNPIKTTYAPGEKFDLTGLKVTPKYSDGSTSPAISGATMTFSPATFASGDKSVTVTATYGDLTATKDFDVTVAEASTNTFTLVTSVDQLSVGDQVIFSNTNHTNLMGVQNTNNRRTETTGITWNDTNTYSSVTVSNDNVAIATLEAGTKEGTFAFKVKDDDKDVYLYAASSSDNYLKSQASIDDNASAKISISSNAATIIFQGTNTRNILRYNSSSKLFSCYESGQQAVLIYKAGTVVATPTFNPVSGTAFDTETATVTITAPEGCTLKYTVGSGEEQTSSSNTAEVTVSPTAYTITAKSVNADGVESNEATATYTFNSAQTVTLKELVELGNDNKTDVNTVYTILNDLRGVRALSENVILAKDENGNAVDKVTPAGNSFMINAKSKFDDDATEESVNAKAQEDYDQSNWVEIVLPSSVSAADYVDKIITGLSVKGYYKNTTNPRLEASAAPAAGGATGAYTRNAMCPANFMGTSQACNADQNHGDFFFMTPKPNEYVQVVWAVYNETADAFYIPAASGSINSHGFVGAFSINWAYNAGGEITNLTEGGLYQFAAVVKKPEPGPKSPKRKIAYDNGQELSTAYVVYPLNLDANYVTGITETTGAKTVKSVRYFNIMGVELAEPTAGVNIVLTTYTDGTTHSQKILK